MTDVTHSDRPKIVDPTMADPQRPPHSDRPTVEGVETRGADGGTYMRAGGA